MENKANKNITEVFTSKQTEIDDIIVKSKDGIITRSMLTKCIDDYINMLPVPDYIYSRVQTFEGLISYIYKRLVKHVLPNTYNHDYKLLDSIFNNLYIPLCNIYGYVPNILLFCNLCNIDSEYISLIHNDNNSGSMKGSNNNREYKDILKGWYSRCEASLRSQVSNHSSIGSMFLLKAKYGYRENDVLTVRAEDDTPKLTAASLAKLAITANNNIPDE